MTRRGSIPSDEGPQKKWKSKGYTSLGEGQRGFDCLHSDLLLTAFRNESICVKVLFRYLKKIYWSVKKSSSLDIMIMMIIIIG